MRRQPLEMYEERARVLEASYYPTRNFAACCWQCRSMLVRLGLAKANINGHNSTRIIRSHI